MESPAFDLEERVSAAIATWAVAMRAFKDELENIARGKQADQARLQQLRAAVDFAKLAYEEVKADRDRQLSSGDGIDRSDPPDCARSEPRS